VQTWPRFHWRLVGRIPRERFRPMPRVDSAILRLDRRPVDLLPARQIVDYERFVALGFSGVGGSLRASLRQRYPARRVDAALRANRVPPETLVGYVWPEQWIALFQAVHGAGR
jgi:23S rRNA (adenine-N6)-dimethyltransferase